MKSHKIAGQFNLRGKAFKMLRCKCCSVEDFRWREAEKLSKREIKETSTDPALLRL